jgi:hypothetical protein
MYTSFTAFISQYFRVTCTIVRVMCYQPIQTKYFYSFTGTIAILKRTAARQELRLAEAANFADKPFPAETLFPFVEVWSPDASRTARKRKAPDTDDEAPKGIVIPTTSINLQKFSPSNQSCFSTLPDNCITEWLPDSMKNSNWLNSAKKLTSASLSSNTWHKYHAAFNKFSSYLSDTNQSFNWPVNDKTLNGFVLWCKSKRNISPQSVQAYIFGLSKIQQFFGFDKIPFKKSIAENLINGWCHSQTETKKSKGKMTVKILSKIKKILKRSFSKLNYHTIWAACCLAFFSSCRMGEILSNSKTTFDNTSTLLWEDLQIHHNKLKFKIKNSKTSFDPESIYLFSVPNKKLCPILAIKKLKFWQVQSNIYQKNLPVFRLQDGSNLTKSFLNKWLAKYFTNISCHSFRNAIPTLLADHPEIASDDCVKNWGRWKTDSFESYQKSKSSKKKWLFDKIIGLLFCLDPTVR